MLSIRRRTASASHRSAAGRWLAIALTYVLYSPPQATAQIDEDAAVPAGARALDSWWDYPWYDDQEDDVRRVNLRAKAAPSRKAQPTTTATGSRGGDLEWIGWLLMILLAVGVMLILLRMYRKRDPRRNASRPASPVGEAASIDRLEELPFQLEPQSDDPLTAARRAYEQEDYDRAIILLYSHQLLQLDQRDAIHLTKGKTNRQYLRELRTRPAMAALLAPSMVAFEDVFFGGHKLTREKFERCWNDANELLSVVDAREAA
jgi:hypothetical protein